MAASAIVFYVIASIVLIAAALVIVSRNVMHSAIYLVLAFLSIAGLYVLLSAEFLAVVQVLVYAGGIVVLFLFLIMLVNLKEAAADKRLRLHAFVSGAIGIAVGLQILYVYARGDLPAAAAAAGGAQAGNLQVVGWELYTRYLLPFEIVSVLLLVAMVGAIVLARQKV